MRDGRRKARLVNKTIWGGKLDSEEFWTRGQRLYYGQYEEVGTTAISGDGADWIKAGTQYMRFWRGEMDADKTAAYATLYEVLLNVSQLAAPFVPFTGEIIHRNLVFGQEAGLEAGSEPGRDMDAKRDARSVHLCSFPEANLSLRDAGLEEQMDLTRRFVVLGRSARNKAGVKVRQPLGRMNCLVRTEREAAWLKERGLFTLVLDELNVKELAVTVAGTPAVIAGAISRATAGIAAANDGAAAQKDQVTVEDSGYALTLVTALDAALLLEGVAREMVHKIQAMRKETGLEVTDRILVRYRNDSGDALMDDAVRAHREFIIGETMAVEILPMPAAADGDHGASARIDSRLELVNLNGHEAALGISRYECENDRSPVTI